MRKKTEEKNGIKEIEKEPEDRIEELKEQVGKKEKEVEELTNLLKRVKADFENFEKRVEREKAEIAKMTTAKVISQVLPFLDSFELALKNKGNQEEFLNGIKMVYAQIHSLFKSLKVEPINALNQPFDPRFHEVLMVEENSERDNFVSEEFQKGYLFDGIVLRTSKVKLTKKKSEVKDENRD